MTRFCYPETQLLELFPGVPAQLHSELSSHLYTAADATICAQACRTSMLPAGHKLKTRISQNAADVLQGLLELREAGVVTTQMLQIHMNGVEVISG